MFLATQLPIPFCVFEVCRRGPFGGSGGNRVFSDAGYAGEPITRVKVRSGSRIHG